MRGHFNRAVRGTLHLTGGRWQRSADGVAAGPTDLNCGWGRGCCQNLDGAVLGPAAIAGLDFARGAEAVAEVEAHCCADAIGITGSTRQPDAQSRFRMLVMEQ